MGIELIVGALSVASTAYAANQKDKLAKEAAEVREKGQRIQRAEQKVNNRLERRKAIRDARRRAAMIDQAAENSGAEVSSGAAAATQAPGNQVATGIAQQRRARQSAIGISRTNQQVANIQDDIYKIDGNQKIFQAGLGAVNKIWGDG